MATVRQMMGRGTMASSDAPLVATLSTEFGTVGLSPGAALTFGRGSDVDVRIGAAPIHDDIVPRLAGRLFAYEDRVMVENLDDALAFDLRVDGRPLLSLAPGDVHSPREASFDVLVRGGVTTYELAVRLNVDGVVPKRADLAASAEELGAPTGAVPTITDRQRRILDAYVEPMRRGGLVASHQQVADQLGISRSLVRVECERIWSALFLAGVPMRDLGDARDEIVDAWSRHRF